jgi:hypothetical protein
MLKRSVLLASVLFITLVSQVQSASSPISKGALTIGGGGTYLSIAEDTFDSNERLSIFALYPSIGYFASNSFNVGVQLVVASVSVGEDDVSLMAIGPQLTYYLSNPHNNGSYSSRAMPYVTASARFGQYSDGKNTNFRTITLGAGVTAMLAKNIGCFFEANFNFDHTSHERDEFAFKSASENTTSWDGDHLALQLGLRLFVW